MFPLLTHVFFMLLVVGVAIWGATSKRSASLSVQDRIVFAVAVVVIMWTALFIWWARHISNEVAPYTLTLSGGLLAVGLILNFLPKKTRLWKWGPLLVSIAIYGWTVYFINGFSNHVIMSSFKNLLS
ncbi:MAG TPA: hypothetical protein VM577_02555 [Anaerovoracaceae bacterium]|nr:hypothetical protein [Anaerovoracaceae bacterium]